METILLSLQSLGDVSLILAAVVGVAWGIVGGAMPGISPSITMALLLPFTYTMMPAPAIVLLASTYVGAEYGGSIPAILIRTPGTNAAAATVIDGYEMNRQGKAGEALGISLYSGVLGSLFGLTMLVLLSKPLAGVALAFTPPAYFALGILGLSVIATLSGENIFKGFAAATLGLMIATIGTDPVTGGNRFTFGSSDLLTGIAPVMIMVGLFAMSELLVQAADKTAGEKVSSRPRISLPDFSMIKRLFIPQTIGAGIGTFEGCMPGAGGTVASFMSYNEARRWSPNKKQFGKGAPEGIAAPETANNAVAETALVPLLSFGIPGSNSTAILLGGFLIHGIAPGPLLFQRSGEVVYGLYGGLFVAAMALLFGRHGDAADVHLDGKPPQALAVRVYLRADHVGHLFDPQCVVRPVGLAHCRHRRILDADFEIPVPSGSSRIGSGLSRGKQFPQISGALRERLCDFRAGSDFTRTSAAVGIVHLWRVGQTFMGLCATHPI